MSSRIPVLSRELRLRKREPVAYHARRSEMHKLNESAYRILGLVDGARSVQEIAGALTEGDEAAALDAAPRIETFLDRCSQADMIEWKSA